MEKKILRRSTGIGCLTNLIAAVVFFVGFAGVAAFRNGDANGGIFTLVLWSLAVILVVIGRSGYKLYCGNCHGILGKELVNTCPNCGADLESYTS